MNLIFLYYGLTLSGGLVGGILIGYFLFSPREPKQPSTLQSLNLTDIPQKVNLEVLDRGVTIYDNKHLDRPDYIPPPPH